MKNNNREKCKVFSDSKLGDLRAYIDEKRESWFLVNDIAKILGVKNPGAITASLRKTGYCWSIKSVLIPTHMKNQHKEYTCNRKKTVVRKNMLFIICARSRKPNARKLLKFAVEKVIPSLEKRERRTI